MKIAIFRTSLKENERRVPIYPEHLPRFPQLLRKQMIFERDYGRDYGFPDAYFLDQGARIATRGELLAGADLLLLPKPMPEDLHLMKPGQVLFGWAHCVQQHAITQPAIDRRLTVIAWEAMHHWNAAGDKLMHMFYKNNEIAGYAAVLHCLQLLGLDGHYGPRRRVVVLSYGSVSRGAIYALQGRGFNNIHVFTRRPPHLVADQNPDVYHGQYWPDADGMMMAKTSDGTDRPLIEELADADVICNGVLQDTNAPFMFVRQDEVVSLRPRSLIIDISCDLGMGFSFARPTTFDDPTFQVGEGITYYSVDHTPTYLWNAASREISKALLPYLGKVAAGQVEWERDVTIKRAVEIRDGVILNPNILSFQKREPEYPHRIKQQVEARLSVAPSVQVPAVSS
jgi:alanine dehydrogenase